MIYASQFFYGKGGLRSSRAFTLIELLVVIGVIVIMLGGLGVALSGGNKGQALEVAQGDLASLIYSARAKAALEGRDAGVAVYYGAITNDTERQQYLRYMAVVQKNASGVWETTRQPQYLPTGVYFLPPAPPSSAALESGVSFGSVVSDGFDNANPLMLTSINIDGSDKDGWLIIGVNALGRRTASNNGRIILATGNPQPPGTAVPFTYNNAQNVRGFILSKYGVGTIINDLTGFSTP